MGQKKKYFKEDEIDLIELFQTFWNGKMTILKFIVVFFLVGMFVAVFTPKEYTAKTVVIPQTKGKSSSLGGFAAMAGINIGQGNSSNDIPPALYPKVVHSVPFMKELLKVPLKFKDIEYEVTYQEYYKKHKKFNLLQAVKKYTIGLPKVLLDLFKKESKQLILEEREEGGVFRITGEEKTLFDQLQKQLVISSNDKEGFVSLSFSMPEAEPSARMAQKAQQLLQDFIANFKVDKAKEELSFIEERYKEAKKEFTKKQYALAGFIDKNRGLTTSRSMARQEKLQSDYSLVYGVYSELAKRLESQRIKVKEDTPIFTVLEPVTVPITKSKPNRVTILVVWGFLGFILGCVFVFGREWIKGLKNSD